MPFHYCPESAGRVASYYTRVTPFRIRRILLPQRDTAVDDPSDGYPNRKRLVTKGFTFPSVEVNQQKARHTKSTSSKHVPNLFWLKLGFRDRKRSLGTDFCFDNKLPAPGNTPSKSGSDGFWIGNLEPGSITEVTGYRDIVRMFCASSLLASVINSSSNPPGPLPASLSGEGVMCCRIPLRFLLHAPMSQRIRCHTQSLDRLYAAPSTRL